jgi:predicted acyltransferase
MAFSLTPPKRPHSVYSLSGRRFASLSVYLRVLRRSLILFALGLLLNGFYQYDWSTIRIMGVLQRISLAYFLAAAVVLHLSRFWQMLLAVAILVGYHSLLLYVPLPDGTVGDLSSMGSWVGYVDRLILGSEHILNGQQFDPEGLLSTLPATVTVLLGYWTGQSLRRQPRDWQTSFSLVAVGVVSLTAGKLWSLFLPLNKPLWTSSYVLYSAGWCWLLLAVLYATIELMGWRRWAFPLRVMGTNAIAIFVGSGLLARILLYTRVGVGESAISTQAWIYQQGFQAIWGDLNGSLAYALATLLFWWTIAFLLYQQRWFIKI